jgi:uncharacterized protein (TIGR02099 family)
MRARRRRLWTLALTVSAVALIVVVIAVAGFRMLVKAAPGYRDDVEQRVSAALERRVTIRELDLSWRRFRPSLDLVEVTLFGDDGSTPALKLRELNLGIDWLALLIGELQLSELRLAGLALTVERLADGSLKVSGISSDKPLTTEDLRRLARAADDVGRLVVADSQLLWLDYTDPNTFHRIDDIELVFSSRGSRQRLRASAQLPAAFGGSLQLDAKARGELETLDQLDVEARLSAQDVQLGAWLRPWLRRHVVLEGGDAQLQLDTQWHGGQLHAATGELNSGALQLRRAGEAQDFLEELHSEFSITQTRTGGWRLLLDRLSVDAPKRKKITTRGSFEFRPARPTQGLWLSGSLDQLRLDEPGEWLALFDWKTQPWLAGLRPVGQVRDLRFRYEASLAAPEGVTPALPRYALQGRFQGLGVSPERTRPGITGLEGQVKLDQTGGELALMVKDGQLLAPENFDEPLPLAEVKGTLNWRREQDDWLLAGKDLRWHGPKDLAGRGDLELRLPVAGGTPFITLDTQFASNSWAGVRGFFPRTPVIDEEARQWIQTAIVDARVSNGRVQIRGLLDHFPYHNPDEPGLFQIDFDTQDGIIDYAEGWPALDRINSHVVFRGRSMLIDARSARTIGVPVGPVRVEVKDFKKPLLEVDGDVAADAGKMLSFLTESPLRADYAGLVQALKLQGPGKLDLRLEIPLDELDATRVFGVVTLDGRTQLNHAKLPEPITGINGQVRFDNSGLTARDLRGDLLGLKLALQLDPEQQDGQHLTRLQAGTQVAFPRDSARLARLAPASVLTQLRGSSQWQADMLFDASAKPARLRLTSDLKGLWINLPSPFSKTADEILPVSVSLDTSLASGMRADIRYGELLRAALQLRDSQDRWTLERGHILFGADTAQLPAQPGLRVEGRIAELDVAQWQAALPATPSPASAPSSTAQPPPDTPLLQAADLRFGRLLVADQIFEDLRLQLTRESNDYLLNASSTSVEGTMRWPQRTAGRQIYRADLQRLVLRAREQTPAENEAAAAENDKTPPRDPASLPGLSLRVRNLRVGEHDMGQLQIDAVPVANGLSLSTLTLTGDLEVQGSGSWTRLDGESSAQLSLSAKGSKLKQIFAALGYAPSLEAEKVRLQASLAWSPRADGIKTEALGGGFNLDLEQGVLMAVEPGAGRILGLLNFTALPRRLTLDFRDVLSKGLAFDTLKGDFRIEDGNAWTDNLKIRGPSLRMEIEGRVGLAARDYDQKITIQPQVTQGVALAGAVAGGPAVGLAILVAQRLFKKPLEEMSELSYRLSGPWDDPIIDRGS